MMSHKPEFYKDGDKYIALTGECPKKFKDFLFIAFAGPNAGSITETCVPVDSLGKLTKIDATDVPDDWATAFEAAGIKVNSQESTEMFHGHLAADCDMFSAAIASDYHFGDEKTPLVEDGIEYNLTSRGLLFWLFVFWWASVFFVKWIN